MGINDVFSYILLPGLFAGIAFLNYKIQVNKRYDILFNIDWESLSSGRREKLLKSLTWTGIIFSLFSMLYFPILKFLEINNFTVVFIYIGLSLVMGFIYYGFILTYKRSIP